MLDLVLNGMQPMGVSAWRYPAPCSNRWKPKHYRSKDFASSWCRVSFISAVVPRLSSADQVGVAESKAGDGLINVKRGFP